MQNNLTVLRKQLYKPSFLSVAGWVLGNMLPFFYILKMLGHLRVPANEETIGLDESYHGGGAYPGHGIDSDFDKSHQGNDSFKGFDKVRPHCLGSMAAVLLHFFAFFCVPKQIYLKLHFQWLQKSTGRVIWWIKSI